MNENKKIKFKIVKRHRHRYKPTYWEKAVLGRTLEKYDFCLDCGKEEANEK